MNKTNLKNPLLISFLILISIFVLNFSNTANFYGVGSVYYCTFVDENNIQTLDTIELEVGVGDYILELPPNNTGYIYRTPIRLVNVNSNEDAAIIKIDNLEEMVELNQPEQLDSFTVILTQATTSNNLAERSAVINIAYGSDVQGDYYTPGDIINTQTFNSRSGSSGSDDCSICPVFDHTRNQFDVSLDDIRGDEFSFFNSDFFDCKGYFKEDVVIIIPEGSQIGDPHFDTAYDIMARFTNPANQRNIIYTDSSESTSSLNFNQISLILLGGPEENDILADLLGTNSRIVVDPNYPSVQNLIDSYADDKSAIFLEYETSTQEIPPEIPETPIPDVRAGLEMNIDQGFCFISYRDSPDLYTGDSILITQTKNLTSNEILSYSYTNLELSGYEDYMDTLVAVRYPYSPSSNVKCESFLWEDFSGKQIQYVSGGSEGTHYPSD